MHEITRAQFNACINYLKKTSGTMSRHNTDAIFVTLKGSKKKGDKWYIPTEVFWDYMKQHYGDVLIHRRIIEPADLIDKATGDYQDGGNNYLA